MADLCCSCVVNQARVTTWSTVTLCVLVLVVSCLPTTSSLPRRLASRRWYVGGRPIRPSPGVRVRVSPRSATMHYGDTASFRCTARGGSAIIDMPFIKFSVIRLSMHCLVTFAHLGTLGLSILRKFNIKRPSLRRAYKCGIVKGLFTFQELLHDSGAMLFRKMQFSMHCLNTLLPPEKTIDYVLRNSDTSYVLPQCSLSVLNVLLLTGVFLRYRYISYHCNPVVLFHL